MNLDIFTSPDVMMYYDIDTKYILRRLCKRFDCIKINLIVRCPYGIDDKYILLLGCAYNNYCRIMQQELSKLHNASVSKMNYILSVACERRNINIIKLLSKKYYGQLTCTYCDENIENHFNK